MMALKLAWRNIWRNKRRTILTALAITFAITLTVVVRGMLFGMYEQMISFNVMLSVGHVQIQGEDYWDTPTLQNSFEEDRIDMASVSGLRGVAAVSPKLAVEALVAIGDEQSSGARIEGIDPVGEAGVSVVPKNIVEGRWFGHDETEGIVIGSVLAKNIEATVGDTLVFFTQGFYGALAAGLHPVLGIFDTGNQRADATIAYTPIRTLQEQLDADGRLTALVIAASDYRAVPAVTASVRDMYGGEGLSVLDYPTLLPDLMSLIAFHSATRVVMIFLLIVVASFCILETILMSVMERYREFGVMRAIGMYRRTLVKLIVVEGLLVATIGAIAGNIIGYSLNAWFRANPIVLDSWGDMVQEYGFLPELSTLVDPMDQLMWTAIIFGITLIAVLWPARVATRISPVEAIRQS